MTIQWGSYRVAWVACVSHRFLVLLGFIIIVGLVRLCCFSSLLWVRLGEVDYQLVVHIDCGSQQSNGRTQSKVSLKWSLGPFRMRKILPGITSKMSVSHGSFFENHWCPQPMFGCWLQSLTIGKS